MGLLLPLPRRELSEVTVTASQTDAVGTGSDTLLEARHLVQEFVIRDQGGLKGGVVHAVSDVSFEIKSGETLGIVGETGSGKSTLARAVLQVPRPKSGEVWFRGQDLVQLKRRELNDARRHVAMVFQDPYSSLDPKWRVADIVEEPHRARRIGTRANASAESPRCSSSSAWTRTSTARAGHVSFPAASVSVRDRAGAHAVAVTHRL